MMVGSYSLKKLETHECQFGEIIQLIPNLSYRICKYASEEFEPKLPGDLTKWRLNFFRKVSTKNKNTKRN